MSVKICECTDMKYVESVICGEEMWARISEDDQSPDDFIVEALNDNWIFYEICTPDGVAGLFLLHPLNVTTIKIHAHVLEPFREKYAEDSGWAIIQWIDDNLSSRINKVVAEIPTTCQDVYHYTKKFGFKDEGLNRKSILYNGEFIDQYYLGITREEIRLCLQRQAH